MLSNSCQPFRNRDRLRCSKWGYVGMGWVGWRGGGGWEGDTETELSLIPRFNQKRVFWYRTDFDSSQTFMRLYLPALMPGPTAHGLAAEFVLSPESRNCHSRPAARHFSRLRVSRAFSSGFCRHDADPVQVFTASEWPPPCPFHA